MEAVVARACSLLRASARASVVLTVVAGLAGGLVLAAWSTARRSDTSFDRFLAATDEPNVIVNFCAPDATPAEIESEQGCPPYDPIEEADAIRGVSGVRAVTRSSLVFGAFQVGDDAVPGAVYVTLDAQDIAMSRGSPLVTRGRLADPDNAHEVMLSEETSTLYSVDVGDRVPFTFYTQNDDVNLSQATGRTAPLTIVGIVRITRDITALTGAYAADLRDAVPYVTPAFWERYRGDAVVTWGIEVGASVADQEVGRFDDRVRERFPGRAVGVERISQPARATIHDAIGYETSAFLAVAGFGGIAWAMTVGVALLRQSAHEHEAAAVLRALGMTRAQLVVAASLRAAPVALGAALIAVGVALAASLATPFGVAARAEVDPGLRFDPAVAVAGFLAVAVGTTAGLAVPSTFRPRSLGAAGKIRRSTGISSRRPSLAAGLSLVRSPRGGALSRRVSMASCALAVACSVAAFGLTGSLRGLTTHPRSYGTTWSASVAGPSEDPFLNDDNFDVAIAAVQTAPDVAAAAGFNVNETSVVGELTVPTVAFWTLVGPPQEWPTVTAGRVPRNGDEVSLGPKTMRALGVRIGDQVFIRPSPKEPARQVRVVGESLVYDGRRVEPGESAVVDASWFSDLVGQRPLNIVLRSSRANPDWESIEAAGLSVVVTPPPAGVRNLTRVDDAPQLVALIAALLAAVVLIHTTVAMTRADRRQLAILRAIGFRRRQVAAAVTTVSILIVSVGVAIGLPLGRACQQWIWAALARRIGFDSPDVTGWAPVAAVVAAAAIGLSVGAIAGWRAGRRPASLTLRVE
jgi:hypothetical protein